MASAAAGAAGGILGRMKTVLLAAVLAFPAQGAFAEGLGAAKPQTVPFSEAVRQERLQLNSDAAGYLQLLPETLDKSPGPEAQCPQGYAYYRGEMEEVRKVTAAPMYLTQLNKQGERFKAALSCALRLSYESQAQDGRYMALGVQGYVARLQAKALTASEKAIVESLSRRRGPAASRAKAKAEGIVAALQSGRGDVDLGVLADRLPVAERRRLDALSTMVARDFEPARRWPGASSPDLAPVPAAAVPDAAAARRLSYGQVYTLALDAASRSFGKARAAAARLVTSMARIESDFKTAAISGRQAVGLMQVVPGDWNTTRAQMLRPRENVDKGTGIFRMLLERYSGRSAQQVMAEFGAAVRRDADDVVEVAYRQVRRGGYDATSQMTQAVKAVILALAAYNAGMGRVDQFVTRGRSLPAETRAYVVTIMRNFVAAYQDRPALPVATQADAAAR